MMQVRSHIEHDVKKRFLQLKIDFKFEEFLKSLKSMFATKNRFLKQLD